MDSKAHKPEIVGWWSYLRTVLVKPSWEFITTGTVATLLYVVTWWRDNTESKAHAEAQDIRRIIPHWSPWIWICIGLVILLYLAIRASYALWNEQQRTIELLIQPEELPATAPQVALRSETGAGAGPIERLMLWNISGTEHLYNLSFRPAKNSLATYIAWKPTWLDKLQAGEQTPITAMAFVRDERNKVQTYSGLPAIHSMLTKRGVMQAYDVGPVVFECEDGRQNRYVVTFQVSLNQDGDELTVHDLDKKFIGVRTSRGDAKA